MFVYSATKFGHQFRRDVAGVIHRQNRATVAIGRGAFDVFPQPVDQAELFIDAERFEIKIGRDHIKILAPVGDGFQLPAVEARMTYAAAMSIAASTLGGDMGRL